MTRKDYILIVRILNRHATHLTQEAFMALVNTFCDELKRDNPRFEKEKFMNALLHEKFN